MKDRLSRITTRTGDHGETGMADGSRLRKNHPRCEAMGDVDELNSHLGLLAAQMLSSALPSTATGDVHGPSAEDGAAHRAILRQLQTIQDELFDVGGGLSMPGHSLIQPDAIPRLEAAIEAANAGLPPLKEFLIPGGSLLLAQCHVARTVARRAERRVAQLVFESDDQEAEGLLPAMQYLNRLSDWLFVVGRCLAVLYDTPQPQWRGSRGPV